MFRRLLVALFWIGGDAGRPISKAATKSFAFSLTVGSPIGYELTIHKAYYLSYTDTV